MALDKTSLLPKANARALNPAHVIGKKNKQKQGNRQTNAYSQRIYGAIATTFVAHEVQKRRRQAGQYAKKHQNHNEAHIAPFEETIIIADMANASFSFRIVSALIVLALVAAICGALGQWQLNRAAEREAILVQINAGRQQAPLVLAPETAATELQNWRQAHATGQWLNQHTVLVANRNHNGRPGYWVATPLLLNATPAGQSSTANGAQHTGTAVLVLRGWIPRPLGMSAQLPPLPATPGVHTISGELRDRVPRLFELWSFRSAGDNPGNITGPKNSIAPGNSTPEVQNIDLENFASITGIKLLPAVLQQTSAASLDDGTPLIQNWPTPSVEADKNRGYALQWFAFAAIASGAWLVIAWRAWRRRKPKQQP